MIIVMIEKTTNKYPKRKSFFMDLTGTQVDTNLNTVIEIQKIELYFVASYLVAIPSSTAYEAIQLP